MLRFSVFVFVLAALSSGVRSNFHQKLQTFIFNKNSVFYNQIQSQVPDRARKSLHEWMPVNSLCFCEVSRKPFWKDVSFGGHLHLCADPVSFPSSKGGPITKTGLWDRQQLFSYMLMNYLCPKKHFREMCNLLVLSPTGPHFGLFLCFPTAGQWMLHQTEIWRGGSKLCAY